MISDWNPRESLLQFLHFSFFQSKKDVKKSGDSSDQSKVIEDDEVDTIGAKQKVSYCN